MMCWLPCEFASVMPDTGVIRPRPFHLRHTHGPVSVPIAIGPFTKKIELRLARVVPPRSMEVILPANPTQSTRENMFDPAARTAASVASARHGPPGITSSGVRMTGLFLLGLLFFLSGLGKAGEWASTVNFVGGIGLPFPALLVGCATVTELVFPVLLLFSTTRAFAAIVLALYTLAAAILFHDFWRVDDEMQSQLIQFLKDLALTGALLYITADARERVRDWLP